MIGPSDYDDWMPEYEDFDEYGSYDEDYDKQRAYETEEVDPLPEDALDCAVEAQESESEWPEGLTPMKPKEDPLDRYCFLYWA